MNSAKKNKTMRYLRTYLDLCFEKHALHKRRFIDDDLCFIWEGGMQTALAKPAFQQARSTIQKDTEYGDDFINFANKLGLTAQIKLSPKKPTIRFR